MGCFGWKKKRQRKDHARESFDGGVGFSLVSTGGSRVTLEHLQQAKSTEDSFDHLQDGCLGILENEKTIIRREIATAKSVISLPQIRSRGASPLWFRNPNKVAPSSQSTPAL